METFLKEYLSVLKLERNLSNNTITSYKSDISSLLHFLEEKKINDLSEIKFSDLKEFFKVLNKIGLTNTTAARYFSSIKSFFSYLHMNNYIAENPTIGMSRIMA